MVGEKAFTVDFENLYFYALWGAITKRFGKDGWDIVWMVGETLFQDIRKRYDFSGKTPVEAMQMLAAYLRESGYFEGIEVRQVGADELEYDMLNTVVRPAIKRLFAEFGRDLAVPGHLSTSLMFAALKNLFGLKTELTGPPEYLEGGWARERWRLSPLETAPSSRADS